MRQEHELLTKLNIIYYMLILSGVEFGQLLLKNSNKNNKFQSPMDKFPDYNKITGG
jgi:hypothetical protein